MSRPLMVPPWLLARLEELLPQLRKAFDESRVRRHPKGTSEGGRFMAQEDTIKHSTEREMREAFREAAAHANDLRNNRHRFDRYISYEEQKAADQKARELYEQLPERPVGTYRDSAGDKQPIFAVRDERGGYWTTYRGHDLEQRRLSDKDEETIRAFWEEHIGSQDDYFADPEANGPNDQEVRVPDFTALEFMRFMRSKTALRLYHVADGLHQDIVHPSPPGPYAAIAIVGPGAAHVAREWEEEREWGFGMLRFDEEG